MTARGDFFREAQVPDIERRVASMVRLGIVSELDEVNARVRVTAGDVTTGWLPWTVGRAGPDRQWTAPEIGEQVIMVAPSGDLAQAVVVGSIYTTQHPAPGTSKDVSATEWQDGAREEYDRQAHTFGLTVPAGGHIRFTIGGTTWTLTESGAELVTQKLTVRGDVEITGAMAVQGDTMVAGITSRGHDISSTHKHTNSGGPGVGGVPV